MDVDEIGTILKLSGTGRSWASVANGLGFSDCGKVFQAIHSYYNRLVDDYTDDISAQKLIDYTSKNNLIFPDEDYLCALHEVAVGKLYEKLGTKDVFVGDQRDETGEISVADFLNPEHSIQDIPDKPLVSYSHDPDLNMLTVSDYNQQYTLICLSQEAAKVVDPSADLEGFWADADTDASWWVKG